MRVISNAGEHFDFPTKFFDNSLLVRKGEEVKIRYENKFLVVSGSVGKRLRAQLDYTIKKDFFADAAKRNIGDIYENLELWNWLSQGKVAVQFRHSGRVTCEITLDLSDKIIKGFYIEEAEIAKLFSKYSTDFNGVTVTVNEWMTAIEAARKNFSPFVTNSDLKLVGVQDLLVPDYLWVKAGLILDEFVIAFILKRNLKCTHDEKWINMQCKDCLIINSKVFPRTDELTQEDIYAYFEVEQKKLDAAKQVIQTDKKSPMLLVTD